MATNVNVGQDKNRQQIAWLCLVNGMQGSTPTHYGKENGTN